jgi:hypothetical protein
MMLVSKLTLYCLLSAAALYAAVNHALATRESLYPSVIFLVSHKPSVLALANAAVLSIVLLARGLKSLFLGELRPGEMERVNESLRYTIPEVCIALTIFREELNFRVLCLFAMLLFSKFFHVLIDERLNNVRFRRRFSAMRRRRAQSEARAAPSPPTPPPSAPSARAARGRGRRQHLAPAARAAGGPAAVAAGDGHCLHHRLWLPAGGARRLCADSLCL